MALRQVVLTVALVVTGCSLDRSGLGGGADTDGGLPRTDAGSICEPVVEICNEDDDDCDGLIDEDYDLRSDLDHCGRCRNACDRAAPNASTACAAGECVLVCDSGFGDCDRDPATGCEADLDQPRTCGSCALACAAPTPLCTGGSCVDACAPPTVLCGSSCVDTTSNPSHCGGCSAACPAGDNAAPTCSGGVCGYACDSGFEDCDGATTAGCEQSIDAVDHCGGCGMACAPSQATGACVGRACTIGVCNALRGDCNGDVADGCETRLDRISSCGACGVACIIADGTATCAGGACAIASCDAGFADCNSDPTDGCETDTTSDPANCAACGTSCSSGVCSGGVCGVVGGTETTCDGVDDDMNGLIDDGAPCPCPIEHRMGHAYLFCSSGTARWTSARDACRANGYELVTIGDMAENVWVSSTANAHNSSDRWWMGFNDRSTEGTWVWVSGQPVTFTGWVGSEPNDAGLFGEDCGELAGSAGAGWVDTGCGDRNFYICEAP